MPRPNVPTLIGCFGLFVHHACSVGVEITNPAPGATWPAGPLTVSWTDAGGSPPNMANLTTCLIQLVVGGVEPDNSKILDNFGFSDCNVAMGSLSGNIDANLSQSIQNGFYFMMTSNTSSAQQHQQQVINYSSRFTLINMNGTTDPIYLKGANSAVGDDNVPAAIVSQLPGPAPTSAVSSSAASTATSASSPPVVTVTATPAFTDVSSDDSSGVSSGTLIGLALGSVAAVVLGVGLLIWASIRWRRRRKVTRRKDSDDTDAILDDKPELPDNSVPASPPAPLGARQDTFEVENTEEPPVEIAQPEMIYELEGDWSPWEAGSGRRSHAWDPTV